MTTKRKIEIVMTAALLLSCSDIYVDAIEQEDASPDADSDGDTDSDSDSDSDTDTDTDTAADSVRVHVEVPNWFSDVPKRLTVQFYSHLPATGPPDGTGSAMDNPPVQPGPPFSLTSGQGGLTGNYYVSVILFVEGGGESIPSPGTDWVGETFQPVNLGPGTGLVDTPPIQLHKAP